MPKLNHVVVTALKDNVRLVTAVKKLRYAKVEGLPNGGMPDGQDPVYENEHAISLQLDQVVELDLRDDQMAHLQAHVDAGDVEVVVHEAPAQQAVKPMLVTSEATPPAPPADTTGKGSKK